MNIYEIFFYHVLFVLINCHFFYSANDTSTIDSFMVEPSITSTEKDTLNKQLFAEVAFQNSGLANELSNSDQPIVITAQIAKTVDLVDEQKPSITVETEATNQTDTPKPKLDDIKPQENLTSEEIPSFSEWTQKRLEAEKNKSTLPTQPPQQNGTQKREGNTKLIWKNYASVDCGAKVVACNPEAVSASAVLSSSRDEYILNTCTSRIWFIVELCEAIQAKKIDFANFELFSSSPKDFSVFVSDRFPTRDWSNVGQFTAKDEHDVQSFDLYPHLFGKYIKVEVRSHYGSEHYCPISLFRVYGTSEFEVLQKEEDTDEDDEDNDGLDVDIDEATKNLFTSATDAVMSMVKKAAQVLGNKGIDNNKTNVLNTKIDDCITPSHLIVCNNCTDLFIDEIFEFLSCNRKIESFISIPFIRNTLINSDICYNYGFNLTNSRFSRISFFPFFPDYFLGAICNLVATNYSTNHTFMDMEKMMPIIIESSIDNDLSNDLLKDTNPMDIKPTKALMIESDVESTEIPMTESIESITQIESIDLNEDEKDNVTEHLESNLVEEPFISEIENTPILTSSPAQKETVFLRLSNRIKALERNMSLSSQYLEELSKRYKKQVEEMQKLLEKTIGTFNEENKKQEEKNKLLQEELNKLNGQIDLLLSEKKNWLLLVFYVLIGILISFSIFSIYFKNNSNNNKEAIQIKDERKCPKRRKSIDVISHNVKKKKKRRPSDQALKIVTNAIVNEYELKERKRRRKKLKMGDTQISSDSGTSAGWMGEKRIEEIPFVLDECDLSTLEPVKLVNNTEHCNGHVEIKTFEKKRLEVPKKKVFKIFRKVF